MAVKLLKANDPAVIKSPNEVYIGKKIHIFIYHPGAVGNGVIDSDFVITNIVFKNTNTILHLSDGGSLIWDTVYREWNYYVDHNDPTTEIPLTVQVTHQ